MATITILPVNPLSLAWAVHAQRMINPPRTLREADPQGVVDEAKAILVQKALPKAGLLSRYPKAALELQFRHESDYEVLQTPAVAVFEDEPLERVFVSRLVPADDAINTYLVVAGASATDAEGTSLTPTANFTAALLDPIVRNADKVILQLPVGEEYDAFFKYYQRGGSASRRHLKEQSLSSQVRWVSEVDPTQPSGVRWFTLTEEGEEAVEQFAGWPNIVLPKTRVKTANYFGTDAMVRGLPNDRIVMRKWFADNLVHPSIVANFYGLYRRKGVLRPQDRWQPPTLLMLSRWADDPIPADVNLNAREVQEWQAKAERLKANVEVARELLTVKKVLTVFEDREKRSAWRRAVNELRGSEKVPTYFPIESLVCLASVGYGPLSKTQFGPIEGPVMRAGRTITPEVMLPHLATLRAKGDATPFPYADITVAVVDANELRVGNFRSDDPSSSSKGEFGLVAPAIKAHRAAAHIDADRRYALVFGSLRGKKFYPLTLPATLIPSLVPLLARVQVANIDNQLQFVPWTPFQPTEEQRDKRRREGVSLREETSVLWGGNLFSFEAFKSLAAVPGTRAQRTFDRIRRGNEKSKKKVPAAELLLKAYRELISSGVGDPKEDTVKRILRELRAAAEKRHRVVTDEMEADLEAQARRMATSRGFLTKEAAAGRVQQRAGVREAEFLKTAGSHLPPSSLARLGADMYADVIRAAPEQHDTLQVAYFQREGKEAGQDILDSHTVELLKRTRIPIPRLSKAARESGDPEARLAFLQKVESALTSLEEQLTAPYTLTLPSSGQVGPWDAPYRRVWDQLTRAGEDDKVREFREEKFMNMNPDGRRPRRERRTRHERRHDEREARENPSFRQENPSFARENTYEDVADVQKDELRRYFGSKKDAISQEFVEPIQTALLKPARGTQAPPSYWYDALGQASESYPPPSWETLLEQALPTAFTTRSAQGPLRLQDLSPKDAATAERALGSGLIDRLTDAPLASEAERWKRAEERVASPDAPAAFWREPAVAQTLVEKASLSVPEARSILAQQTEAARRLRTKTTPPSTALIQPVRVRRLKEYTLHPAMKATIGANDALILISPQVLPGMKEGANPREFRVMSYRRGTHIDLDLVAAKGKTPLDVVGLALQSALYWLAEDAKKANKKRYRRATSRLLLGRIGEPGLYELWRPSPVTKPEDMERLKITLRSVLAKMGAVHRAGDTFVNNPKALPIPGYNAEQDRAMYLAADRQQDARRIHRMEKLYQRLSETPMMPGRQIESPAETRGYASSAPESAPVSPEPDDEGPIVELEDGDEDDFPLPEEESG